MAPRPHVEAQRRQQILEKAMACFAQKGYHLTTMNDIAAQLPFSKSLLYYYFETKRDIFLSILQAWMETAQTNWAEILSPDEDATTQLHKCLAYGVQLVTENADFTRVELEFYGEIGKDATVSLAFRSLFTEFRAQFKAILEAGIASGEFRDANTDALAAILLGIYEGLAMQYLVEPGALDWPVVARQLEDLVMQGLMPVKQE